MNSAPSWFWLMVGVTLESVYAPIWCIFFKIDLLTPAMLLWMISNFAIKGCLLGAAVCVWSYFDTKRRCSKQ